MTLEMCLKKWNLAVTNYQYGDFNSLTHNLTLYVAGMYRCKGINMQTQVLCGSQSTSLLI